jgi:hypothetical protein
METAAWVCGTGCMWKKASLAEASYSTGRTDLTEGGCEICSSGLIIVSYNIDKTSEIATVYCPRGGHGYYEVGCHFWRGPREITYGCK